MMQTGFALVFVLVATVYLGWQIWRFLRRGGEPRCAKCHQSQAPSKPSDALYQISAGSKRS